ncbi:MAG: hypothetical protein DRP97_06820, partial [Candidatus Latescibacterota bacterium]
HISKQYGKQKILENISLEIKSGEIFGIIGLSGSGKTTFLNTIIGFLKPETGDVLFKQSHLLDYKGDERISFRSVYEKEFELKRMFGFAAQNPSFYNKLSCEDNLDYFGSLYGLSKDIRRTNAEILLKLMGIYDFRKLDGEELSGGMQKRLDIACALIHDPHVLILDEPTSDLDPLSRQQMWDLIREIKSKGTTVLLTSHFLDELEGLCDRVAILHNKKIIRIGTPEEIKSSYSTHQEIRVETKSMDYTDLSRNLYNHARSFRIESISPEGKKLLIKSSRSEEVLHHIIHFLERRKEKLLDISVSMPLLKEVMQSLIKTEDDQCKKEKESLENK